MGIIAIGDSFVYNPEINPFQRKKVQLKDLYAHNNMVRHETHFTPSPESREQFPYLPIVLKTLRTHDADQLVIAVNGIADHAPNVDPQRIRNVINHLKTAYTQERDFVEEPEINHALQVGILVATYVGINNITTNTMAAALGHDYFEDTDLPLSNIGPAPVEASIRALSHKDNGITIFSKDNKEPYFRGIIAAHRLHPFMEIPTIKACDQLVVSNSPLTADELTSPDLIDTWRNLSERKITEMNSFLSILRDSGLANSRAANILNVAIPFTAVRLTPQGRQFPLLKK